VAKRKGATLLIDKAGPSMIGVSNIIYSDAAYDITDDVMAEINKSRPAGAAAAAAAPAQKSAPAAAPAPAAGGPSISVPGIGTKK
jgi:outer membrane protein